MTSGKDLKMLKKNSISVTTPIRLGGTKATSSISSKMLETLARTDLVLRIPYNSLGVSLYKMKTLRAIHGMCTEEKGLGGCGTTTHAFSKSNYCLDGTRSQNSGAGRTYEQISNPGTMQTTNASMTLTGPRGIPRAAVTTGALPKNRTTGITRVETDLDCLEEHGKTTTATTRSIVGSSVATHLVVQDGDELLQVAGNEFDNGYGQRRNAVDLNDDKKCSSFSMQYSFTLLPPK